MDEISWNLYWVLYDPGLVMHMKFCQDILSTREVIIQLLTNEALDMMWYRPDNTNIDRGEAKVNIGILWSISHHIQCLICQ